MGVVPSKKIPKGKVFSPYNQVEQPVQLCLVEKGKTAVVNLSNECRFRHGSQSQLVRWASKLLERDFEINPTKDLVYFLANEKVPYYFALESPSSSHKTGWAMDCAMRVVFDSLEEPTVVLIELIRTNGRVKGKGAATWLIDALLRYCKENQVDVFVTSTTEAVS